MAVHDDVGEQLLDDQHQPRRIVGADLPDAETRLALLQLAIDRCVRPERRRELHAERDRITPR